MSATRSPERRAWAALAILLLLAGCTAARLELDKMANTSFPPDRYFPQGVTDPNDFLNIPRIFAAGGRLVVVDEDDDIPLMSPEDHCITNDELEDLVLTHRDGPVSPTTYACFGGFTCTDHHVYGVIVGYNYGGSTGICQFSKAGFMGDPANRGVFFVFHAVGQIMFSERNFLKAAAHELGHSFNLHHEDAQDGSLMTEGFDDVNFFFSPLSEAHLKDHPTDKVWPNTGAFDDFTNAHGQGHAAMLAAGPASGLGGESGLELLLEIEPANLRLGEPVYLVTRLRNPGSQAVAIPQHIGPEVGTLQIEITDPSGAR